MRGYIKHLNNLRMSYPSLLILLWVLVHSLCSSFSVPRIIVCMFL